MFPNTSSNLSLPYLNSQNYDITGNNYNRYSTDVSENYRRNNSIANTMINNRLDKLNYQKTILSKINNPYQPAVNPHFHNFSYDPMHSHIHSHSHHNLASFGHHIMHPNYYYYDISIPIYHPLELPQMCSPVAPPKYTSGGPVKEKHCCKKGNGLDILLLLTKIGEIPPIPEKPKEKPKPKTPEKEKEKIKIGKRKKKFEEIKRKDKVPPNVKKPLRPRRKLDRDWWKLCKNFVNLYVFWGTALKYSKNFKKMRENSIEDRTKALVQEISILKDWLIAIEEPFWNEFKIFDDLNVAFKNSDAKNKIKKQSQKIIAIIKKFIENLISRSSKLSEIPNEVQKILYEFIKERAYFPKKYLSTYQINRLDFEFYGGTRKITVPQAGMIIAYLVICGICVQQILLHMKEVFEEFAKFPYIDISAKYIGSIMHYLTRDTFMYEPGLVRNIYALFNYYRNYHLYNEEIEKKRDVLNGNLMMTDNDNEDEFAEFLINENDISEFWNINPQFVENYKAFISGWSLKIAKAIKLKFEQIDPNPLPRERLERPPNKTMILPEEKEEEEKNENEEEEDE